MRLFAAVYPPPDAVTDLTARVARLRVGAASAAGIDVRLADPARLHVTLAFLGEVPAERLSDVQNALGSAADAFRELRSGPPTLCLAGGGRFGRGRSTVLWVDVRGEVDALHVLGRLIRSGLRDNDLPYDDKPFRPHLTIARPGDRIPAPDVQADQRSLTAYTGPPWPATHLVLTQSHQSPHPTYTHPTTWPL
ncbi:RNA 2',3'-cyclic phosphodiesterase [Micromonospora sp. NPDC000089]|uniref:RNA 2',3'-cyclic phosphodiesterase n=1 Tax=unclassified Micromonospora TaxID=2617518 RepID=UPI00367F23B0